MRRCVRAIVGAVIASSASLTACTDRTAVAPIREADGSQRTATASVVPLDVFGIDKNVPRGGEGCRTEPYRQFDFWLGTYDVFGPSGVLAGTNVVELELDGCVVEENWTDGGRGRSLNFYDASLDRWTQFWVYSGGGAFTPLLLEGGFAGGVMSMAYDRTSPAGFFFPNPPPGRTVHRLFDRITWTPLQAGVVRQLGERALDNDPAGVVYDLRYQPVAHVTPIPVNPVSVCQTRPGNRQFDFMLGDWDVFAGDPGRGSPQARASFSTDLGGCLVEEHLEGRSGYRGWSFNSWSVFTGQWHRTYVDNSGRRLESSGVLEDGKMVLTGVKRAADGAQVQLRVTWEPIAPGTVRQRWEFSRDGGATWPVHRAVTYLKR